MSLQLHLHEPKLVPIGRIAGADRHAQCGDNIHQDSLAQPWFRLYKLRSPLANLLGYTNLLHLTACADNKKSPAA